MFVYTSRHFYSCRKFVVSETPRWVGRIDASVWSPQDCNNTGIRIAPQAPRYCCRFLGYSSVCTVVWPHEQARRSKKLNLTLRGTLRKFHKTKSIMLVVVGATYTKFYLLAYTNTSGNIINILYSQNSTNVYYIPGHIRRAYCCNSAQG